MKKTILAITTFTLGILSVTSLSFIQNGNAMTSRTVISTSVLCLVDEDSKKPISGLDNMSYYQIEPYSIDIGSSEWEFSGIKENSDNCYEFYFEGEGSMQIRFDDLPAKYTGPTGRQIIYNSYTTPFPAQSFQLEVSDAQPELEGLFEYDISDYLDGQSNTGADLKEYVEIAEAYKDIAQDYADLACDEADAARAAREEGDYEAFQEHMENSEAASDAAKEAADQAQIYADTVRDIVDTALDGGTTSDGGLGIEFGWFSESGLGQTYDIEDITNIWDITPNWSREDLMGVYTDPTWGMENIPPAWEFDQYVDPEYWIQDGIIQESYYGENPNDDYYQEAIDFYENILVGDDLIMFQEDEGYHDFLVNVYVNTFNETAAYQATVTETYTQGYLAHDLYETNIQGQVDGYDAAALNTLSSDYWDSGLTTRSTEMYFGSESTDADYLAAVSFYEDNLSGTDLSQFQNNESYHNYLVNSYIAGVTANAAYTSTLESNIDAGIASFSSFNTNFSDTSMFESSAMTQMQGMQESQIMQNIFNFTSY